MRISNRHWRGGLVLLLIAALAAALRFWQLDAIPPGFHFDESFEGLEAWRILVDPTYRPVFLTGNFGVPPLNAYANAVAFGLVQLLGGQAGPTAMRATAAIFGLMGVLALFALGGELRRLSPELPAVFPLLAATFLATMRWHVHFSRMGIEPVMVPLIWAASTWLLLRGWRNGSWVSFLLSGALLAAAMYTYQGAWIIPLLAGLVVLHLALDDGGRLKQRWPGLLVTAGVALLLVLPLALFFGRHPDLLLLRPGQISTVGEGVAGGPAPWANLWATARMFLPVAGVGDLDPRRNLPGLPALNLWQALPFFLGLGVALWRIRRPAYSILLIGLVGLLLPGVLSEYAPHFHRVLGAAAPAALLCGLGLAWLWQQAGNALARTSLPRPAREGVLALLATLVILLGGITAAHNYFVRWAGLPDLFYAFDAGLWEIGQWIAGQPAQEQIYLTPSSGEHPTLAFAWRPGSDARPGPYTFDGRHAFPLTAGPVDQAETYVVVEHEDFRTRLLLPEVFPDAEVAAERLDGWGELYARRYLRPAQTAPQRQPRFPVDADLGDGIRLLGYDLVPEQPRQGQAIYLQLHWLVEAAPGSDWTVFTHLLGPPMPDGNRVWAGKDSIPGAGSLPTSRWQPGWRILDEYQVLASPAEVPAGAYELEVGLYGADGQRLPPAGSGLTIGPVQILPP